MLFILCTLRLETIFSISVISLEPSILAIATPLCILLARPTGFRADDFLKYRKLPDWQVVVNCEEIIWGLKPSPNGNEEEFTEHKLDKGLNMVVDG